MKSFRLAAILLIFPAGAAVAASETFDPCSLLTAREIEEVQGIKVASTKASQPQRGHFAVSQCFYTLTTFSRSISLEVTRRAPGEAEAPRTHWKQMFARALDERREEKEEREVEEESRENAGGGKEKETEAKPRPVAGVGDEAFWTGSSLGGGLFVLKGDAYFRLSVGGPDSEAVKIEKLKKLARKALRRLR